METSRSFKDITHLWCNNSNQFSKVVRSVPKSLPELKWCLLAQTVAYYLIPHTVNIVDIKRRIQTELLVMLTKNCFSKLLAPGTRHPWYSRTRARNRDDRRKRGIWPSPSYIYSTGVLDFFSWRPYVGIIEKESLWVWKSPRTEVLRSVSHGMFTRTDIASSCQERLLMPSRCTTQTGPEKQSGVSGSAGTTWGNEKQQSSDKRRRNTGRNRQTIAATLTSFN